MKNITFAKVIYYLAVVAIAIGVNLAAARLYPSEITIIHFIPALIVAQLGWWLMRRIWPPQTD